MSLSFSAKAVEWISNNVRETVLERDVPKRHRDSVIKMSCDLHWNKSVGDPLMELLLHRTVSAGHHVHCDLKSHEGNDAIEFRVQ